MVRFARARGSKASNQKLPEEATPWEELRKAPEPEEKLESVSKVEVNWKEEIEKEEKIERNQNSSWAEFDDDPPRPKTKKRKLAKLQENEVKEDSFVRKASGDEAKGKTHFKKFKELEKGNTEDQAEKDNTKGKSQSFNEAKVKGAPEQTGKDDRKNNKFSKKFKKDRKFKQKKEEGFTIDIGGRTVEIVKFDGFPIKKEDAAKIKEFAEKLRIKGVPRAEIKIQVKNERRRAEKALAREKKRVCFNCRRSGHDLSECPEQGTSSVSRAAGPAAGICFKCGSTEHTYFNCKVVGGDNFAYATCFICKEQGHLSRQCPDNPRGLYPKGGACRNCGDVTHFKKDCPKLQTEKAETKITLSTLDKNQALEGLEEEAGSRPDKKLNNVKRPNKIIKF